MRLNGLSPESLWHQLRTRAQTTADRVITDPDEAEAFAAGLSRRR